MEVVVTVNTSLYHKSSGIRLAFQRVIYTVLTFSIPTELLGWILSTVMYSIDFTAMIASITMVLMPINLIVHIYFAWQLRQIITSLEGSREVYDPIQKLLEKNCLSALSSIIFMEILTSFWIVIPVFHENLYIVYTIGIAFSLAGAVFSLYWTPERSSSQESQDSTEIRGSIARSVQESLPAQSGRPGTTTVGGLQVEISPVAQESPSSPFFPDVQMDPLSSSSNNTKEETLIFNPFISPGDELAAVKEIES